MLAGVVLVLALIGTMIAVNNLTNEQQHGQAEPGSDLPGRYRAARDEMLNTLAPLIYDTADNATVMYHFRSIQNETETQARNNGLHAIMRLANGTDPFTPRTEWELTVEDATAGPCPDGVTRRYNTHSFNGSHDYTSTEYDCANDGLIFDVGTGEVRGVVVYLFVADHRARVEETLVLGAN